MSRTRHIRSRNYLWAMGILVILLSCAPFVLSDFRLNLLGKFMTFAIVAVGLVLIWGYAGILSLGHGIFFGLGAYCMAMYLKLEAAGGKLPDFMVWSGLKELPWFWIPFQSPWFAVAAVILVPMGLAALLGFVIFRNRVRGVFFTILTQALVIIITTLFIGQQAYTGGTNGITGFHTVFGFSLSSDQTQLVLYMITLVALIGSMGIAYWIIHSRLGRILQAIRDGENRLRFFGYNPGLYKTFIFSVSAGMAGLAGALFVMNVGIISPNNMGIVPSIEMVLWVAIGGRNSVMGGVLGALAMNAAKSLFSEAYPDIWMYFLGALFVVVVILLPKGMVSLPDLLRFRGKERRWHGTSFYSSLGKGER